MSLKSVQEQIDSILKTREFAHPKNVDFPIVATFCTEDKKEKELKELTKIISEGYLASTQSFFQDTNIQVILAQDLSPDALEALNKASLLFQNQNVVDQIYAPTCKLFETQSFYV